MKEEELARKFREGDPAALEALLASCDADLRRAAERGLPASLRRRVSVADVMQEARFAAFEARGGFEYRGDGSFRRWAVGIAVKKALMAVRAHLGTGKRSARREGGGPEDPTVSRIASPGPSPSEIAVAGELEECARRALESLPEDRRTILRLTREEGLTVAAAGESMDLPPASAKRLYGKALREFREGVERLRGEGHG
ncbi:MAG: RNA polymerase sigma factor [Planctomycetes bacterium]|nr:RNA polymerase sigma factor [Planctomycetota bacterium]